MLHPGNLDRRNLEQPGWNVSGLLVVIPCACRAKPPSGEAQRLARCCTSPQQRRPIQRFTLCEGESPAGFCPSSPVAVTIVAIDREKEASLRVLMQRFGKRLQTLTPEERRLCSGVSFSGSRSTLKAR